MAREPKSQRQRGAALVELTLIIPFLVVMAMGLVEMGMAWRDSLTLDQATRAGARIAANASNDPHADREALRSFVATVGPDINKVEYVVIYEVTPSGGMPAGCETSSNSLCNRYTPADLHTLADDSKWECSGGARDRFWCPSSRNPELTSPVDLGIYAHGRHDWITGMFPGDGVDLNSTTIMRLNPLHR